MKRQEEMNMSELMNFNREVVNYINDNLQFIKENAEAVENKDLASESLNHYKTTVEAYNEEESYLSKEQEEQFLCVARELFINSFYPHAGSLNISEPTAL
jgi:ABC-type transporter lipoprotein component MlaA